MKKITYILALALGVAVQAQTTIERNVIGNATGTISNGTVSLDMTAGEPVIGDITNGTITLQQGFHQTRVELRISLNPIAFLQGPGTAPFAGEANLMRDNLRSAGLLPTTSPYDNTVSVDESVFSITGSNAIVDWVLVELRQGANSSATTVVTSVSAFMQRDGDIVALDGVSGLSIDVTPGDYFVAINHRNHLGVLTNDPLSLGTTALVADFTDNASFVRGGNIATRTLPNGKLALIAGDATGDGQIFGTDTNLVRPLLGSASSYSLADINMDGQFFNNDISLFIRVNLGRGQQF